MTSETERLFEYRTYDGSMMITGCQPQTGKVSITDQMDGLEVTRIAERAFSDADWLMGIELPDCLHEIGAYAFRGCRGIKKLTFPEQIHRIGSHAFYNCRNLEHIKMPSNLRWMEDGAFKNCGRIQTISLIVRENILTTLPHLFDELQQQMTVHLIYGDEKKVSLFFPRDLVLYSEYTSRLYNPVAYGVGYQYRQTVRDGQMDYPRYDALFLGAQNELTMEQLGEIAVNRLMTPESLRSESKHHYEVFVSDHSKELMDAAIVAEDKDRIQFLLNQKRMSEEDAKQSYELAKQKNQVETGVRILQYLQKYYPKLEDEFEL